MATVICVVGTKGGVGKSMLCTELATYWHRQDKRVRLIDTDPQKSSLEFSRDGQEAGYDVPSAVYCEGDVRGVVADASPRHDFVIIDTQGRSSAQMIGAMATSQIALIPVSSDVGLKHVDMVLKEVRMALEYHESLIPIIVPTRIRKRTSLYKELYATLEKKASDFPISRTEIREREAFRPSLIVGSGVPASSEAYTDIRSLAIEIEELVEGVNSVAA